MRFLTGEDFNFDDLKYFNIIKDEKFDWIAKYDSRIECNNITYVDNFSLDSLNKVLDELEGDLRLLFNQLIPLINSSYLHTFECIRLDYKSFWIA